MDAFEDALRELYQSHHVEHVTEWLVNHSEKVFALAGEPGRRITSATSIGGLQPTLYWTMNGFYGEFTLYNVHVRTNFMLDAVSSEMLNYPFREYVPGLMFIQTNNPNGGQVFGGYGFTDGTGAGTYLMGVGVEYFPLMQMMRKFTTA